MRDIRGRPSSARVGRRRIVASSTPGDPSRAPYPVPDDPTSPVPRTLSGVILTVLALASACTGADPAIGERTPSPSDRSPDPSAEPPAAPTRFPIKHVVFLIKENRSFDNLFGRFPGANGATVGMHHGAPRPLIRGIDRLPGDLPHCYSCAIAAWNHGAMDDFEQGLHGKWA